MAYLYIKKRGSKKYYYLRESFRKKEKIFTKDICYLGKNIFNLNMNKLNKFSSKIKNFEFKMEYFNKFKNIQKAKEDKYFNKEQINEINVILKLHNKSNLKEKTIIKFIKENNSLDINESNYPKIKEIENLIKYRLLPKKLPLIQTHKLINTKKIIDYLDKNKPRLNVILIEKITNMLYDDIYKTIGFRTKEIKNSENSQKINQNLRILINWFNKKKTKIHPLALVILFHHKFERIRPFALGNGEVGRILLNYQLSQLGCPRMIIPASKKQEYFYAMNFADKAVKKDLLSTDMRYYKPLMDFMQKCFVKTYWNNFI